MAGNPTTEKVIPYALLGMTAVTGLVLLLPRFWVAGVDQIRARTPRPDRISKYFQHASWNALSDRFISTTPEEDSGKEVRI